MARGKGCIKNRDSHSTIGALYIHEVARDLLISESMVRKLLTTGELAGVKIGKRWIVMQEDIQKFVNERKGVMV